ncbi:butyrophilin subfamily 3 member A2-like [Epinephelus lanceolatus]|uniref:butyrophilin subfamily 3 member A2-like n=1 Tax=Epinephelus lanceolatus TaxID=310571 RepID=UPI001445975F|nr:butyrophilin subfamily 3 member A2-like [Epinephelus lanceolatus]
MYYRLFLVAALLCCCSGESSVHGSPKTALALAGEDVILPCSFSNTATHDFPAVEWSKAGLQPDNIVFLYRDGCEDHAMKNAAFRYRTSLISKELKNGNISLRISNVQLSDAGTYQCKRLWSDKRRDVTAVELVVDAVSEPKLSVTSVEGGDITLQCEAKCWKPEPEITFLDDQANDIRADDPRRDQDARGCFTVKRRVTLKDAASRITCRVHQPETNQTRTTHFPVIQGWKSCSLTTAIAVGGTILLLLAPSCGLGVYLWRRCGKSAEESKSPMSRQSSDESTLSGTSETEVFLKSVKVVKANDVGNQSQTIEMLTKQVADLNSKLHEKDETIRQLQNNNNPQLSAAVCQYDQPTTLHGPPASTINSPPKSGNIPRIKGRKRGISRQNSFSLPSCPTSKARRYSCPILNFPEPPSTTSASTKVKKLESIGRSMSDTCARPRPKFKLQRQNSLSNNRFFLLENLTEESD